MTEAMDQASDPDFELCTSLQDEEWQVLEAIYPDYLSNREQVSRAGRGVRLEVPVELDDGQTPREIVLHVPQEGSDSSISSSGSGILTDKAGADTGALSYAVDLDHAQQTTISLSTLPPILLDLIMPAGYPLRKPPIIVSLHASFSWLPRTQLNMLEKRLLSKWEGEQSRLGEGQGILFDWIEMIRSAEFLDVMNSNVVRIPHQAPTLLGSQLTRFDNSIRLIRFSQTAYTCEICLSQVKGAKCIMLRCEHVFCRTCLMEFWQLCIAEGAVDRVGCPDPHCVKEGQLAEEEEVRRVVGTEEEVQRWKWIKTKKDLEKDPTIIYCPLSFCQAPVRRPAVEDGRWERLRSCPACGYSFCMHCKRTWHGPHTNCPLPATEEIVRAYLEAAEGSELRREYEQRYGEATVRRLVITTQEGRATMSWLRTYTQECPGCRVYVEKSMGCNHMTCAKCGMHFCYRCGRRLEGRRAYVHFTEAGQGCYGRLFEDEGDG